MSDLQIHSRFGYMFSFDIERSVCDRKQIKMLMKRATRTTCSTSLKFDHFATGSLNQHFSQCDFCVRDTCKLIAVE